MSVAIRQWDTGPRNWACLTAWPSLIGLSLMLAMAQSAVAADEKPKGLPPAVERVLRWLPEDTETLIVAQTFTISESDLKNNSTWQDLSTQDLSGLNYKKYLKKLEGQKIAYAMRGAKNFDVVSSFGGLRNEGCEVISFEKELGTVATEFIEDVRAGASEVRQLAGREVFVFPSTTSMEPWVKQTASQGTFLVLLKPDTLLCASSDRYLAAVLQRIDNTPATRALPDNLPEWKHVDIEAPTWILRHVPERSKSVTAGVTAVFDKSGYRVTYLPKVDSRHYLARIEKEWVPGHLSQPEEALKRLKFERKSDGAVFVSGSLLPKDLRMGMPIWLLLSLQGYGIWDN